MKRHHAISALWKAFYSKDLYQDVRQNWGFSIVWYLLFVVIICSLITITNDIVRFKAYYHAELAPIVEQIPTGSLIDGKLSIEQPSPYTITYIDDKTHEKLALAVFDTKDQLDPAKIDAPIILQSTHYLIRDGKTTAHVNVSQHGVAVEQKTTHVDEWKSYKIKGDHHFSAETAKAIIAHAWLYLPVIIVIFSIIISLIFRLLQALIYALIVLIFGAIYKDALTYAEAYCLAIIAVGPSIFITTLVAVIATPKHFHHLWSLAFIVQLIYMLFAAYSNRRLTA